ncbi:MAG: monovalent cation/H+ antiporter complex subunit F [Gammaproteobacteria bacterium]|nr:monovalent cation/H+ antiporter complex subunit F [Gammaproteobacteria bacterium]MDH5593654.1 monovalent cation/H+ antiporter complex subunit F [Gammaproteobacteria bacterium]
MFTAAILAILVTMGLALARALMGPTVYDRIAAVNMFGTKTVLLIAIISFLSDRTDLLDIALVYALINFIGIVAVLKLVVYGNLYSSEKENPKQLNATGNDN